MDNIQVIRAILELGWPAIVLLECVILWRDNVKLRDKLVEVLENKEVPIPSIPATIIHSGQD